MSIVARRFADPFSSHVRLLYLSRKPFVSRRRQWYPGRRVADKNTCADHTRNLLWFPTKCARVLILVVPLFPLQSSSPSFDTHTHTQTHHRSIFFSAPSHCYSFKSFSLTLSGGPRIWAIGYSRMHEQVSCFAITRYTNKRYVHSIP